MKMTNLKKSPIKKQNDQPRVIFDSLYGVVKLTLWKFIIVLHIRENESHVYGKRQTSDSSWEFLKIENEQMKQSKTILIDENNVKLYLFLGGSKHR